MSGTMSGTWVPDRRQIRSMASERSLLGGNRTPTLQTGGLPPPPAGSSPLSPTAQQHSSPLSPRLPPPIVTTSETKRPVSMQPMRGGVPGLTGVDPETRAQIAPFSAGTSVTSPRPTDPQQLRNLVKKLWTGVLPLANHPWKGLSIPNCFVASECLSWLQKELGCALPVARDTMKELQKLGYLVHAVTPEPLDNPNNLLYRLSMPSGAIPGQETVPVKTTTPVSPAKDKDKDPSLINKILRRDPYASFASSFLSFASLLTPASTDTKTDKARPMSVNMGSTAPHLGAKASSANLMAPKTLEVRERPAKFLRRTTQEQHKLQQERQREANWIPKEIRGDWEVSIWVDTNDAEHKTIELGKDKEGKLEVLSGTLNALIRHLTSEKTGPSSSPPSFSSSPPSSPSPPCPLLTLSQT